MTITEIVGTIILSITTALGTITLFTWLLLFKEYNNGIKKEKEATEK